MLLKSPGANELIHPMKHLRINDLNTTKQSTAKPYAYFMGYIIEDINGFGLYGVLQGQLLWPHVSWYPRQRAWLWCCACWHCASSGPRPNTSSGVGLTRNHASKLSPLQVRFFKFCRIRLVAGFEIFIFSFMIRHWLIKIHFVCASLASDPWNGVCGRCIHNLSGSD